MFLLLFQKPSHSFNILHRTKRYWVHLQELTIKNDQKNIDHAFFFLLSNTIPLQKALYIYNEFYFSFLLSKEMQDISPTYEHFMDN